jgi:CBS domain-containing protein
MNTDVKTVGADWPLNRVAEFLLDHEISGAPVVGDDDQLVGVVSTTDLARHNGTAGERLQQEKPPAYYRTEDDYGYSQEDMQSLHTISADGTMAEDVMTPEVYDVSQHTSVQQVAQVMLRGRIHRVFVTEQGEIRGVITAHDMLRVVADL